jgi:uncharacterized membrane protein
MNTRTVLKSALACAVALGLTGPSAAQVKAKERCFGIAKPGQNDCANLSGSHSCAGQSRVDKGVDEWRYVPAGTCKQMKGTSEEEARALMATNAASRPGTLA